MTFHYFVQLIERQVDAVIRNAALRKVVGPNTFTAIPRPDQQSSFLSLFGFLLGNLRIEQSSLQQRHGACPVLVLRSLVLAFDNDASRKMGQSYGGIPALVLPFVDATIETCPFNVPSINTLPFST